jgi:hypothetical protein
MPFVRSSGFLLLGLLLLCLLGPVPAAAETWTEDYKTQFGTLTLKTNRDMVTYNENKGEYEVYNNEELILNGKKIEDLYYHTGITKIISWEKKGDIVLLNLWSGGASCCHSYDIVHLTKDGHKRIGEFAHHGYNPSDFKVTPDEISFRLERNFPADIDHWIVHYNGDYPIIETIVEDDSGIAMAAAGTDVTRWAGKYVWNVLEDASERVRFRSLMNPEQMNTLRSTLGFNSPVVQQDGYVFGTSCRPHDCIIGHGFFAIEIATGRPYAAYFDRPCTLSTFGAAEAELPPPMKAQIDERSSKIECATYESRYIQKAEPTGDGSAD